VHRLGDVERLDAQYARERLGLSRSSVMARRSLALRLDELPRMAEALGAGQLGVEAALQIVRVATPMTHAVWVERAQRRTVKHLREEVAAALVAVRLSGETNCPPPTDEEMAAFHELERAVVSGQACQALLDDRPVRIASATPTASAAPTPQLLLPMALLSHAEKTS